MLRKSGFGFSWGTWGIMVSAALAALVTGCRGGSEPASRPAPVGEALVVPGPAVEAPVVAPPAGEAAAEQHVDLDASFHIPQKDGAERASHTPAVVFSKDQKRMVTATSDGEVVVFDSKTREVLRRIPVEGKVADAVAIDPEGQVAVWALAEKGLVAIDLAGGKVIARDEALAAKHLALSPDASRVALARGGEVEVRDARTLALLTKLGGHEGDVTNLAWSPDSKSLGSTGTDGALIVQAAAGGAAAGTAEPRKVSKGSPLYAVAFHPQGKKVAFGGQENRVYELDLASGKEEVVSGESQQPYWITCLGYSPDGEHLAVGDESCDIWLYGLADKKLLFHNKHHVECWLGSVAWAGDNETFLFGCRPNTHAQKPAIYEALTLIEAARSEAARKSRKTLLAAVEEEAGKLADGEDRKALLAYRDSVAREESIVQQAYGGWLGFNGGWTTLSTVTAQNFQIAASQVAVGELVEQLKDGQGVIGALYNSSVQGGRQLALEKLPEALRQLAEKHQGVLQAEAAKLNTGYNCNSWRVVKKASE
jgi:hypothetical protein